MELGKVVVAQRVWERVRLLDRGIGTITTRRKGSGSKDLHHRMLVNALEGIEIAL